MSRESPLRSIRKGRPLFLIAYLLLKFLDSLRELLVLRLVIPYHQCEVIVVAVFILSERVATGGLSCVEAATCRLIYVMVSRFNVFLLLQ